MAMYNPALEVETKESGPESRTPAPISSSYCVPYGSEFTVSSKSTLKNGDIYTICDSQGQQMFDVGKGSKHGWLHRQLVLRDPSGKTVAFLKPDSKVLTMRHRWDVYGDEEASDSSFLFTIRSTGWNCFADSFEIFLVNNQSKSPDFNIIGKGIFKLKFTILNRGSPVAEARTKGGDYTFTVNRGVDLAFISSLIVIIDQAMKSTAAVADGVGGGVAGAASVASVAS